LRSYHSHHFATPATLRRAVPRLLEDVTELVIEGGGALASIWADEASLRGIHVQWVTAEDWRQAFLYPREQRNGELAKRVADDLARRVIGWSGARRPTSLRHDAAEAILIGLWGVLQSGWLPAVPHGLVHAPPTAAGRGKQSDRKSTRLNSSHR